VAGETRVRALHTTISVLARFGGPSRSVPSLVAALSRQSIDARLIAPAAPDGWPIAEMPSDLVLDLQRGELDGEGLPRRMPGLDDHLVQLVESGATVLHDHGCWRPTGRASAAAARRTGAPRVVSPRGMLLPSALNERPWRKRVALALWQRRDLAAASLLHATSAAEAESLSALRFGPPVALIPTGVSLVATGAPHLDDIGDRPRVCLYVGRLAMIKQLPLLLAAWASVRPTGWRLVLVGPDERGHAAELKAQAAKLGIASLVDFVGALDDATTQLRYLAADVAVLPSRSESFGMAVAEALAAGVPVVATHGVPWPVLATERCGWHVAERDLADALRAATAMSPADRRNMGARGRALIARDYAWPVVAARMSAVYRWLLTGGTMPAEVRP
jgi:glycosyltransferase involved in cell wall biosynthesis